MLSSCDIGNPIYKTNRQPIPKVGAGLVTATIWIDGEHSLERDIEYLWSEIIGEDGVDVIVVKPSDLGTPYLKEDIIFAIEEDLGERILEFNWS